MGGRGRTGTVLGVALVRLGHAPDAVVDYLHRVAVGRGRRGWPESAWQADIVRATSPLPSRRGPGRADAQGMSMRSTAGMPAAEPWNAAAPNENTEPSAPRM